MNVCGLMAGMGESGLPIHTAFQRQGHIIALDFSAEMCRRARIRRAAWSNINIDVLEQDVFNNSIAPTSMDCVISTFGLKTLTEEQKARLAHEIARILKPQGTFSLLEISVPPHLLLRLPYLFLPKSHYPHHWKNPAGQPRKLSHARYLHGTLWNMHQHG